MFGYVVLFDYVDFLLEVGEWVGLIGCNGVGKLLLLKIVVDFVKFDDGLVMC